jgi:HD-GYP domain-containing protein (c-di-GMP phosphodiesterase class II)
MSNIRPDLFARVYETLEMRCRTIGVPLWRFDGSGSIIRTPTVADALSKWLSSATIRARLEMAAHTALNTKTAERISLFPGACFLPLEEREGTSRVGLTAAVIFSERIFKSDELIDECAASGLNLIDVSSDLTALIRSGDSQLEQTIATVRWTYEDLLRTALDSAALDQFGEKLSQAYEETALLFRLSRLLGCVSDPVELVRTFCQQLQEIMPFAWLGVRFDPERTELSALAGKMIVAGTTPCGIDPIESGASEILRSWGGDDWTRVLRPGESALADAAGSEVLAEPITFDGRVIGGLFAGNKRGPDSEVSSEETQFIDAAASFLGIFHENAARFGEQRAMFLGVLKAMTASIDAKDRYTCGHSERVGLLASRLAQAAGLDPTVAERYRIAGLVHDVGKIGISEAVLSKTGKLTTEEFDQIKKHPEIGHQILRDIPLMQDILPGVLHHHERYDGRGYPHNLAGEEIPLIARMLALADTFDSMSSTRSYRPAMPREKVIEEIKRCSGTQFDPQLAEIFISLNFSEFDRMLSAQQSTVQAAA